MQQEQLYISPENCRTNVDEILVQIDWFIVRITKSSAYASFSDWDKEEVAQQTRMKLAMALRVRHINNLKAYIKVCVHNEFINLLRHQRPWLPLATTEDGELQQQGLVLMSHSQGMGDPQIEVERKQTFQELLEAIVRAILTFPRVQQRVMVCFLREYIDDPVVLAETFRLHNVDITDIGWPQDNVAKQRLQSSYSPARRKLAQSIEMDLSTFKMNQRKEKTHSLA